MPRGLDDDLRANRRRTTLWTSAIATVGVAVVGAIEVVAGVAAAVIVVRVVMVVVLGAVFVALLTRRMPQRTAEGLAFVSVSCLSALDLLGRLPHEAGTGAANWLVAWLSYATIVSLAPYAIWPQRTARRVTGVALGGHLVLLAVATRSLSLSGTLLLSLVVPAVVVLLAEALAETAAVLGRHEARARAEAEAGRIDQLTGLANRRGVVGRLEGLEAGDGLLLVDVDNFKQVNDDHGHQAGDVVLRQVAATLRRAIRGSDVVSRWGGEEFLVVVRGPRPQADAAEPDHRDVPPSGWQPPRPVEHVVDVTVPAVDGRAGPTVDVPEPLRRAAWLGERLRVAVGRAACVPPVTISVGVASMHVEDEDWQDVLRRADACLYAAKDGGRDRVVAVPTRSSRRRQPD